jgi:hypothetical protein
MGGRRSFRIHAPQFRRQKISRKGIARRDKMIHVINVINIQRSEIQNLHILKLPACAEVI